MDRPRKLPLALLAALACVLVGVLAILAPGAYVVAADAEDVAQQTGAQVRAGLVPGAAWVDVTHGDVASVVLAPR
jgi:sarcosine oxidase gamma subunit